LRSEPPLVSAIVTTRNSEPTLEDCLRSLRDQTHTRIEIGVVDNRSTDGTTGVAGLWADLVTEMGPERSTQRNHGARLAAGDFFLFVDSDMILGPDVVADCLALERDSGAPAVIIPETSVGNSFWARCRALERSCYDGDDQVEAARFYRKDAFWLAGGFDEAILGGEDWDLSRRVAGGRSLPRTGARVLHNEGKLSLGVAFAKKRYYAHGYLRYFRKHGSSVLSQGNVLVRAAFLRHWRRLLRHPVLAVGVFSLKSVELLGAAMGVAEHQLATHRHGRARRPQGT
jgi:glycosyltransferase involved in cell wall biosynthesis